MGPETSSRINTVNALLDGYGSLSVSRLLEPLADDFHHQVLPESLQMKKRNKEEFARHARGMFDIFDSFRMIPQFMTEDAQRGVVVVHAHMQGMIRVIFEEWRNECVMIIRLSEDGTKIIEVQEFVDSIKAAEMRHAFAPRHFEEKH